MAIASLGQSSMKTLQAGVPSSVRQGTGGSSTPLAQRPFANFRLSLCRDCEPGFRATWTQKPRQQRYFGFSRKPRYSHGTPSRPGFGSKLDFRDFRGATMAAATGSGGIGDSEPGPSSFAMPGDVSVKSSGGAAELSIGRRVYLFQDAFRRFLRPHTIRGTLLGSTALVIRALAENPDAIDWVLLPRALRGVLALLCGNGYIVGINQIYDVAIDKINKPFLPIAAGDLSLPVAWVLVLSLATLGIGIVINDFGPLITKLYCFGLFLGTIYSVPFFHLKRFAVPAFMIIATVRGFLLNFGVYYATRAALRLPFVWNPSIIFITTFVTVFATVIAITKDLPDIEGDQKFKIATFATRLGVRNIAFAGSGLLIANYVGAIVASIYWPQFFRRKVMISAHAILAGALVYQTWLLDSAKYTKDSIAAFYRFIWNLFYTEYILLPFI